MNLHDFKLLLSNFIPHALTRFGDGEKNIFDEVNCDRKGFKYDKEIDGVFHNELIESYNYKSDNYFVADKAPISACLFVNENYKDFFSKIVPLFNLYNVILVGNEKAEIFELPFFVNRFIPVSDNAWRHYTDVQNEIFALLNLWGNTSLVLFACGPYSNVLIHRIWKENKQNILLNIGSTLDPLFYGVNTRQYQERIFDNDC